MRRIADAAAEKAAATCEHGVQLLRGVPEPGGGLTVATSALGGAGTAASPAQARATLSCDDFKPAAVTGITCSLLLTGFSDAAQHAAGPKPLTELDEEYLGVRHVLHGRTSQANDMQEP